MSLAVAVSLYGVVMQEKSKPQIKPLPRPEPAVLIIERPLSTPPQKWSDADVQALARTLAGECWEDKPHDKRLVCEVVLNRVSDDRLEDSVIAVLETPNAFNGYWQQSRPVSKNDLLIARQALSDWQDNGYQPLSDIRFFCSGENRENSFY